MDVVRPGSLQLIRLSVILNSDLLAMNGRGEALSNESRAHRVRSLLEPLRSLYDLRSPQIEGPVETTYKELVIADMVRSKPTAQEFFQRFSVTYQKAIASFNGGGLFSTTEPLKEMLADCEDTQRLVRILAGQALDALDADGVSCGNQIESTRFNLTIRLALAYKRLGGTDNLGIAGEWGHRIIRDFLRRKSFASLERPAGYEYAEIFVLGAEWRGVLEDPQPDADLEDLRDAALGLREAVRHDPGKVLLGMRLIWVERGLRKVQRNQAFGDVGPLIRIYVIDPEDAMNPWGI